MDVLDERGHGLVVGPAAVAQAVEDVGVHCVVIPVVAGGAADGAVQIAMDDFDTRLHEPTREEKLLAPTVAAVAVAGAGVFLAEVEGVAGLGIREQSNGLRLELVERAEFAFLVEGSLQRVEVLPERRAIAEAAGFGGAGLADVGHLEVRPARVVGDGEGRVGIAQVGRPGVAAFDGVDGDVVGQRAGAAGLLGAEVVRHAHPIGILGRGFVALVRVARKHPQMAGGMATRPVGHRADERELVGHLRVEREQLRDVHPGHVRGDDVEGAAIIGARVGLGVVGVNVRQPADEPDHDDGGLLLLRLAGVLRAKAQQTGQAQRGKASETDVHEPAPAHGAGATH